jgi:hypothetical protein
MLRLPAVKRRPQILSKACVLFRTVVLRLRRPRVGHHVTSIPLGILCLSVSFVLAARAQKPPELPVASVELSVRSPDGQPLARTGIVIRVLGSSPFRGPIPDVVLATDDRGVAQFDIPAGVYGLSVTAHGIGYGDVGVTEFLPGKVTRPDMPPLAGYGSIDIVVPAGCGQDVTIYLGSARYPLHSSNELHVDDLTPGSSSVEAASKSDPMSWLYDPCSDIAPVNILAGQILRVILQPVPSNMTVPARPGPDGSQIVTVDRGQLDQTPTVWVRGTVRDEQGHPIPDAAVYAVSTYSGSIRMMRLTTEARTDANGYYEIKGPAGSMGLGVTVVAAAPGHPSAWAWPEFTQTKLPETPTQDLILPSTGSKANITVLRDGKPVAGAAVTLFLENVSLQDTWAAGGPNKAVTDIAYPLRTTDAHGVAKFEELLPGRYRVLATGGGPEMIRQSELNLERPAGPGPGAAAGGVPVQKGQTTNFEINIYPQSNNASFRILQEDNKPYTGTGADRFGPIDTIEASSSASLDSSGLGHILLQRVGFWRLEFLFRDSPIAYFPIYPPYFQSSGTLALSPNLSDVDPPVFAARSVEPGSARIAVQDSNGHPIHATVQIRRFSSLAVSGTTGEDGVVLFKGLYSGDQAGSLSDQYFIQIRSSGFANDAASDLGKGDDPLPPPQLLHTRQVFMDQKLLNQRLALSVDKQTSVVIRAERLRYVYGVLHSSIKPRYGTPLDEWEQQGELVYGATLRVLPGGEYVAGPFLPGLVNIGFWDSSSPHFVSVPIELDAGPDEPLRFDYDADKYPKPPEVTEKKPEPRVDTQLTTGGESYLGMTGITTRTTGSSHLSGRVFLSDGKTPALGAQVLYYEAGSAQPAFFGLTDALGNLQPRGLWQSSNNSSTGAPAAPDSPVLVAYLPGACGATIQTSAVHPDEPVHLALPSPISLAGKVTVGGASPSHRPGTIHILAAFQGRGFLNSALSVTTTAQADGRFTLAGLTPGTYLIQASLDEIWLSPPEKVRVVGTTSRTIRLAIGLPGAPIRVKFLDSAGNPVAGKSIMIDRTGPLAALWPEQWTSDNAGVIYIPTLETGRHNLRVLGVAKPVAVDVPHLPAKPLEIQVRADQPRK